MTQQLRAWASSNVTVGFDELLLYTYGDGIAERLQDLPVSEACIYESPLRHQFRLEKIRVNTFEITYEGVRHDYQNFHIDQCVYWNEGALVQIKLPEVVQ